MRASDDGTYVDVDWGAIPDFIGGLSSGERRYLLLAASIAGGTEVNIESTFTRLDFQDQDLVISALQHAAGTISAKDHPQRQVA